MLKDHVLSLLGLNAPGTCPLSVGHELAFTERYRVLLGSKCLSFATEASISSQEPKRTTATLW